MIQLKDVIHYYIGQKLEKSADDLTHPRLEAIVGDQMYVSEYEYTTPHSDKTFTRPKMTLPIGFKKPILRRLEDMTEEEMKELVFIGHSVRNTLYEVKMEYNTVCFKTNGFTGGGSVSLRALRPEETHYLLQQGFDLWGLIDSNQAIDSKTLKTVKHE